MAISLRAAVACLLAAGCAGAIGEPEAPGSDDRPTGAGALGAPGAGALPSGSGPVMAAGGGGDRPASAPCGGFPGRPLRRLNRVELNNTIRDLFGDQSKPADLLPRDGAVHFDTNASALALSRGFVESYRTVIDGLVGRLLAPALAAGPSLRSRVVTCDPARAGPEACLRQVLAGLAPRAWRRPLDGDELDALVGRGLRLLQAGDSFDQALDVVLRALLLSPHFLFLVEGSGPLAPDGSRALTGHELAARLSYFLWRTMPDETLRARAGGGALLGREEILGQVDRMLSDPRAEAFVEGFGLHWLGTVDFATKTFETKVPGFEALQQAMAAETSWFFRSVIADKRSVGDLIEAEHTFANALLARHYGLAAPAGAGMQKVPLEGRRVGGVLGQGSILTNGGDGQETNPVKRGAWVLDSLLCLTVPPPPPGADLVERSATGSRRDRLMVHQTKREDCNACHRLIDPIGLALDVFGPVGESRVKDDFGFDLFPVTATVPEVGLDAFSSPTELARRIRDSGRFVPCLADKVMTYALARPLADAEHCELSRIDAQVTGQGRRFDALIKAVATSGPFLARSGGAPGGAP